MGRRGAGAGGFADHGGGTGAAFGRTGWGGFVLRVLSDSVPDWSSRENFVRSALSPWDTDEEKSLPSPGDAIDTGSGVLKWERKQGHVFTFHTSP